MNRYTKPKPELWQGRTSKNRLYLHEKVVCSDMLQEALQPSGKKVGLLGYACDAGVQRNHGRVGAIAGPDAIRKQLAKMPNHLPDTSHFYDVGTIACRDGDMEATQNQLSEVVVQLLEQCTFPLVLGGGHDMAYGHYQGLRTYFGRQATLGLINFDAHLDLRNNSSGNTSGTPFYQVAQDSIAQNIPFHYLCLGIRKDANDRHLLQSAADFGVTYVENINFSMSEAQSIVRILLDFIRKVDHVYVTIDLDGFSSAYAPGVSAPSPMGFSPKIVLESLELILKTKKLVAFDIAEMNPTYDVDDHTARLAASLAHYVIHHIDDFALQTGLA